MTNSLKNKKVLVTGADGFIGSHLTQQLMLLGSDVRAMSQYNSFNFRGWLEDLPDLKEEQIICGDVRDPYFCEEALKGIDIVFHLAALIAIPYSYSAPDSYIDTNIKGTINVCKAAQKAGCEKIVQTSTSEVYGSAQYVPIDENHPLQPQSPYSASKIGSDSIALSFYHSFECPVAIARPFNTFGPRQSARAVIPTIISQLAAGKKEIQLGDLRPTRDFTFVEDTCRGLIAIAQSPKTIGEVVNIGSNFEVSIGDLFERINQLMQAQAKTTADEQRKRPKHSEVQRLWCHAEKLKTLTGFEPSLSLDEGLKKTINWFTQEENLSKYKTDIYNV